MRDVLALAHDLTGIKPEGESAQVVDALRRSEGPGEDWFPNVLSYSLFSLLVRDHEIVQGQRGHVAPRTLDPLEW